MIRVISPEESRAHTQKLIDRMQATLNDPKRVIVINKIDIPFWVERKAALQAYSVVLAPAFVPECPHHPEPVVGCDYCAAVKERA